MSLLQKKVAIVSGGSRGIGKAIVEKLLSAQYVVATFSKSESEFIKHCNESDPQNEMFYWEAIDIQDNRGLKDFVFKVYKKYGRIDCLVNNAGINLDSLISLTSEIDIHRIISINIEALIILTKLVSWVMMAQQYGNIVNISSVVGYRGFKGTAVYAASKAAIIGFTKSIARELGEKNIRVNAVLPGFIETDMTSDIPREKREQIIRRTPLKRFGTTNDIANMVNFLLSDEVGFMTGQEIVIDGGLTC